MKVAGVLRAFTFAAALVAAPAGWACGYHSSVVLARTTLHFVYPNSPSVMSAVWKAQVDGLLSCDDRPTGTKALLGYGTAVRELRQLRYGLSQARRGGHNDSAVSLLLIGPMLWVRFAPNGAELEMTPHTSGPVDGDLVVVTDEPVVKALVEGQISPQVVRELGLMRFYGAPEAVQQAAFWLDRLPQPIENAALEPGTVPRD